MTQPTLRTSLTSTLHLHPRNLSPKKITAQLARYFPKLASTPSTSSSIPKKYRAICALFPQISEHHPP